jgi:predicted metal-binding membrane protein
VTAAANAAAVTAAAVTPVPGAAATLPRPSLRAFRAPGAAALLLVAVGAWVALASLAMTSMDAASTFIPAWALMMTAMMLPAVAPVAALYARTLDGRRRRLVLFSLGYLTAWALTSLPAYGVWLLVDHRVRVHPLAARITGAAIFAAVGLYQLTPLKERCLRHCRSPFGQLMRYASWRGRGRDFVVGLHHAAYCIGCCWALMLLLFAFGAMTIAAALGLAAVVIVEKLSPWGAWVSRAVGVAALVWAGVVLVAPDAAPGLAPMTDM